IRQPSSPLALSLHAALPISSRLGSSKPWNAMRSVRGAPVDGADETDGLDAGEAGAHAPARSSTAQPRMGQRAGAVGIAESKERRDRKSTRLNSSHEWSSYAV